MDRKSKVNSRTEKSANGGSGTKEEALEKLRQMEWVRNKQDYWHLSRPNPRNDVREKKKYNEDNYFDGTTGTQKSKRNRKPRETPVQPKVPPGFSLAAPNGPPAVNAWTQKKGSDLFSKPPEELDLEEDEIFKLALQESIRTAEEEKLRNLERMGLYGAEESYPGNVFTEKEMEDDYEEKDDNNCKSPQFNNTDNAKTDLQFIDTSSTEDLNTSSNQRRRFPIRLRKSSNPQERGSSMEGRKEFYPPVETPKNECHPSLKKLNDNMFEPSRPVENLSPASSEGSFYHEAFKPTRGHGKTDSTIELKRPIVAAGKEDKPIIDYLSADLKSTLTLGDCHYKPQPAAQSHPIDSSFYDPKQIVDVSRASEIKASSTSTLTASIPSETDILIHSFLRHDPPSSLAPNITSTFQGTETPADIFSLNASQQCFSPNSLQERGQLLLNSVSSTSQSQSISIDKSGQSSNSSLSNSPLQNGTPYGSMDKHILTNPEGILQTQPQIFPFHQLGAVIVPNPSITNKLQEPQIASHLVSQVPYPSYVPGFVTHAPHPGLHLNNTVPYNLHNSNLIMPLPFPNQDLPNPLNQAANTAHYNNYYQPMQQPQEAQRSALSVNDVENSEALHKVQQSQVFGQVQPQFQQYQQAQRATIPMNDVECLESFHKEQQSSIYGQTTNKVNQPIMNTVENQSHLLAQNLSSHNDYAVTNFQNQHMQLNQENKPQVVPEHDIQIPKQDGPPRQYLQQNSAEQGFQSVARSEAEIIRLHLEQVEYLNNRLRQQLAEVQSQSQTMSVPQPYQIPAHSIAIGMNSYYQPPLHALSQGQPVTVHLVGNTGQVSPNQQDASFASGLLNMSPENDTQTSLQTKIGRGRGRMIQ